MIFAHWTTPFPSTPLNKTNAYVYTLECTRKANGYS